ncbi:HTH-type transcriptional regulator BetI [Arenibacter antarcticus]|uniref:TetR/AcrR family transcriptional regulator n=1 Tax=Arenibacter antarcticus TaxID=2040469 RepID=A0ABW5VAU1_9FLAO|nr:TetR/AcrR family transcriptional regulator [Arenibacter sp. H213]MCM4167850.1 TetR/AcrR family transcriptional regulator [Arenibacter sp. H213]
MKHQIKRLTTMNRIQSTGLELFYQKGYYNTSIDDILKKLSLSKGAFYYHFQSKEEFFISITQTLLFRTVYNQLITPIEGKEDPLNAIIECMDKDLQTAEQNFLDYGFVLSNFITEFNGKNPEIMAFLQDILTVWEVNLVTILQKGKTDGYISRHTDSEALASYIIYSYIGIRTLMVEGNSKQLRYKYIQQLRQYFKTMDSRTTA